MELDEFKSCLEIFVAGCQKINDDHREKHFPNIQPTEFSYTLGPKYAKVITKSAGSGSVHCFVEIATGDVLKAASWRAPAKHARGNIWDDDHGLGRMGPYGPAYLR